MKKLVIFYSRADENYFSGQYRYVDIGNTEKAARMIAEAAGAELFKIEQKEPYSAVYKKATEQARSDLEQGARPAVKALPDISEADEIYLGYPIYWGTMPMAVYTVLEALDFSGKKIHPFCTHEGSALSSTERDVRRAAAGAVVTAGLAIHGSSVDKDRAYIRQWVQTGGQ